MADNLKGFSEETVRRVSNVGDAIKEIKNQTRDLNRELANAGGPLSDWESSFSSISNLSRKILDTQNKSLLSSKGTGESLKKQNEARNTARALDIKINELLRQRRQGQDLLNDLINRQAANLREAKDQAKILAEEYGNLANSAANLDKRTIFFSTLAKFVSDVKGLRTFAGPFEAAAKASREQVIQNGKAVLLQKKLEELRTSSNKSQIRKEISELTEGKTIKEVLAGKGGAFGAGMKAFTGEISSAFSGFMKGGGPLLIGLQLLTKVIQFFVDAMFAASKQIADFQRNLAVSRDDASEIRDRFFEISDNAKILAQTQTGNLILQKDLVEAQSSFNTALGLAVDLSTKQNEEFAAQFTNVKKFYDLNEQEQKGLINLYTLNGKTVNETKTNILGQTALFKLNTKEAINIRKVYKEILTTSNATKLSIKGGSEALTQAVINAQKLGVTLDSLGKIADNLLNFEQSISAELEAELITGRDLNLERARAAALMNDQVTLTEEVNRLVKDAGPDFEKNRIAMQASANAIGISVEELADMITQQKAVEKFKQNFQALDEKAIENSKTLSEGEKKRLKEGKATAQDYYKFAKEQGKDLNVILGEEMATRLEAQDAQQKFNDALEKAKETFSRFVDGGALDKFADFLVRFVESVNIKGLRRTIFGGLADDEDIDKNRLKEKTQQLSTEKDTERKKQLQEEINGLQVEISEIKKEKKETFKAEAEADPSGTKMKVLRAQEAGFMAVESGEKLAKGGIIVKPIHNATMGEAGPEAVIPLHRLPEMLNTNSTNDEAMNKMMVLLSQQNNLLSAILNKEGTIVLNGTKMGTAMAVGGYKVA
jgi:hypothetical protein